jgi:hypothetical protein
MGLDLAAQPPANRQDQLGGHSEQEPGQQSSEGAPPGQAAADHWKLADHIQQRAPGQGQAAPFR